MMTETLILGGQKLIFVSRLDPVSTTGDIDLLVIVYDIQVTSLLTFTPSYSEIWAEA